MREASDLASLAIPANHCRMQNILDLGMLIMLQAVLGFDNLLYISLESKRAPLEKQKAVRAWGIGIAVVLRIILLFVLLKMMDAFKDPWTHWDNEFIVADVSFAALITFFGGAFIIYTAIKEVSHMMTLEEHHEAKKDRSAVSAARVVALIVMMNLVFSFDSILSAIAITTVGWVVTIAIVISGILMILLADKVSAFLQKNRLYEVLGLFILLIVGVMLVSEGGHKANLSFFGHEVHAMNKTTFYFVIAVLILMDVAQGRYQKKLMAEKKKTHGTLA